MQAERRRARRRGRPRRDASRPRRPRARARAARDSTTAPRPRARRPAMPSDAATRTTSDAGERRRAPRRRRDQRRRATSSRAREPCAKRRRAAAISVPSQATGCQRFGGSPNARSSASARGEHRHAKAARAAHVAAQARGQLSADELRDRGHVDGVADDVGETVVARARIARARPSADPAARPARAATARSTAPRRRSFAKSPWRYVPVTTPSALTAPSRVVARARRARCGDREGRIAGARASARRGSRTRRSRGPRRRPSRPRVATTRARTRTVRFAPANVVVTGKQARARRRSPGDAFEPVRDRRRARRASGSRRTRRAPAAPPRAAARTAARQAARVQPREVGDRRLRARQDRRGRAPASSASVPDEAHAHARLLGERLEVVEVRDARQPDRRRCRAHARHRRRRRCGRDRASPPRARAARA